MPLKFPSIFKASHQRLLIFFFLLFLLLFHFLLLFNNFVMQRMEPRVLYLLDNWYYHLPTFSSLMVFILNPWGSVRGRSRCIKQIEDDERGERIGMKEGESLGGKSPFQDSPHIPKGWTVAAKGRESSSYESCISQTEEDLWETKNVAELVTTILSSHGRKKTTVLLRDTDMADRRG